MRTMLLHRRDEMRRARLVGRERSRQTVYTREGRSSHSRSGEREAIARVPLRIVGILERYDKFVMVTVTTFGAAVTS